MVRRAAIGIPVLAVLLAFAVIAEGQVGLWVSSASGVSTSGNVNVSGVTTLNTLNVNGFTTLTAPLILSMNGSNLVMDSTGAAVNQKRWAFQALNPGFRFFTANDDNNNQNSFITLGRTAAGVTDMTFSVYGGTGGFEFLGGPVKTSSAQPGFLAYTGSNTAFSAGAAMLSFTTEQFDNTNAFDGVAFTAPVTGVYEFQATVSCTSGGGGGVTLTLVTGGGNFQIFSNPSVTTLDMPGTSIMVRLTAGQTARVDISTPSGGTLRGGTPPSSILSRFGGRLVI